MILVESKDTCLARAGPSFWAMALLIGTMTILVNMTITRIKITILTIAKS